MPIFSPQGKLDFTTYPERLTVVDIPPNMINGVLCAMCQEVGRKVSSHQPNIIFTIVMCSPISFGGKNPAVCILA